MKRWLYHTTAGVLAALTLAGTAGAASFTHCARSMDEMGLFVGTKNGYELDRAPTRGEAAVMLVRLLGKEKEAKQKNYKSPFTDVPKWAAPYVGWLYQNQLTQGVSATKFGTAELCNAKQYATFLLRTLGYHGGYTYDNAVAYARERGIVDDYNCDENNFKRDHVVAMSYTALSLPMRKQTDSLLQTLVQQGSVPMQKAEKTLQIFENYKTYAQAKKQTLPYKTRQYDMNFTIQNGKNMAAYQAEVDYNGKNMAMKISQDGNMTHALYYDGQTMYQMQNGKTEKSNLSWTPSQNHIIPISAVMDLQTIENGRYAFSCNPAVYQSSNQTIQPKRISYSVVISDNLLSEQTARVAFESQDGGEMVVEVDAHLYILGDVVEVDIPEGMEIS